MTRYSSLPVAHFGLFRSTGLIVFLTYLEEGLSAIGKLRLLMIRHVAEGTVRKIETDWPCPSGRIPAITILCF